MKIEKYLSIGAVLAFTPLLRATSITETYSQTVSASDGYFDGNTAVNLALNAPWTITSITGIQVTLVFAGDSASPALNSDLLASVFIGDGLGPAALLFDGSTLASASSTGMNVVFSDGASQSIQNAVATGTPPTITGTYLAVDRLGANFAGIDPRSDAWHLNLTDFGSIGSGAVLSWQLEITGESPASSVPDNIGCAGSFALIGMLGLHQASLLFRRKRSLYSASE